MKPWPPFTATTDPIEYLKKLAILRTEDVLDNTSLNTRYLAGRVRTDRAAPATPTDVTDFDRVGDVVRNATYEFLLLNISGVLKWDRRTLNVGW